MPRELSILEAIGKLAEMTVAVKEAELAAMERAALLVQAEAKAEIGNYQDGAGSFAPWAMLADSTVSEKERLGYGPPDNPLLREGDLRDSIDHSVGFEGMGAVEGVVGSNDPVAEYQELGTERIPPRSFLGGAAFRKGEEVAHLLGDGVVKALIGEKVVSGGLPIP